MENILLVQVARLIQWAVRNSRVVKFIHSISALVEHITPDGWHKWIIICRLRLISFSKDLWWGSFCPPPPNFILAFDLALVVPFDLHDQMLHQIGRISCWRYAYTWFVFAMRCLRIDFATEIGWQVGEWEAKFELANFEKPFLKFLRDGLSNVCKILSGVHWNLRVLDQFLGLERVR